MGTSRSGRYLNTKGNRRHASDFALVHSNEGKFKWRQPRDTKNGEKRIRLESGGHGEDGRKLLDKYRIEYDKLDELSSRQDSQEMMLRALTSSRGSEIYKY